MRVGDTHSRTACGASEQGPGVRDEGCEAGADGQHDAVDSSSQDHQNRQAEDRENNGGQEHDHSVGRSAVCIPADPGAQRGVGTLGCPSTQGVIHESGMVHVVTDHPAENNRTLRSKVASTVLVFTVPMLLLAIIGARREFRHRYPRDRAAVGDLDRRSDLGVVATANRSISYGVTHAKGVHDIGVRIFTTGYASASRITQTSPATATTPRAHRSLPSGHVEDEVLQLDQVLNSIAGLREVMGLREVVMDNGTVDTGRQGRVQPSA
jgi:hypothetical protein